MRAINKQLAFALSLTSIIIVFSIFYININLESPKLILLMKSNSPIVGLEKIGENKFLIIFMKSFVEHD